MPSTATQPAHRSTTADPGHDGQAAAPGTPTDPALTMPRGLDPAAEQLWRHGDDTGGSSGTGATLGDPPIPGDLWVAAAAAGPGEDVTDLALVLITAVNEEGRYVLCVPVTTADQPTGAMAQKLDPSPLGVPLVVWPQLETGVDFETLDRRLGAAVEALTLVRLRMFANGDGPAPLPVLAEPDAGTNQAELAAFATSLCRRMQVVCYANSTTGDDDADAVGNTPDSPAPAEGGVGQHCRKTGPGDRAQQQT